MGKNIYHFFYSNNAGVTTKNQPLRQLYYFWTIPQTFKQQNHLLFWKIVWFDKSVEVFPSNPRLGSKIGLFSLSFNKLTNLCILQKLLLPKSLDSVFKPVNTLIHTQIHTFSVQKKTIKLFSDSVFYAKLFSYSVVKAWKRREKTKKLFSYSVFYTKFFSYSVVKSDV